MSFVELSVSKTDKQSCFAGDRTGTAEPDEFRFLWPLTDRTAEMFSVLQRLRTNTRLLFTTFVYPKKSSGTGFSVVGFLPTKWYEQTNRFCGGNFLFKAASHCLLKSGSSGIRCNLYGGVHEQSFFSKDLWSKQGKFSKLFSFLWFQLQPLTAQFAPLPCLFCRSVAIITCSSEYTDRKSAA